MEFYGQTLEDMTPEKWDGKSRYMICGDHENNMKPREVVGYFTDTDGRTRWMASNGISYLMCADIKYPDAYSTNLTVKHLFDIHTMLLAGIGFNTILAEIESRLDEVGADTTET